MLKRVSIQNFKSLKDVTLDLQKVNLLIGPNNSGKTNFLKALEFCYDSHASEEKRRKPYPGETNYPEDYGRVPEEDIIWYEYSTNDKYTLAGSLFKRDYKLQIDISMSLIDNGNDRQASIKWSAQGKVVSQHISEDKENTYLEGISAVTFIRHSLGQITIYKPDPNRIAQPALFSADEIELKGDCSNLIPFLFYLNTNYKRAYQQIEKDLAECVGDIVSFSTPPVKVEKESKLGLKFFGKKDEDYWAEDISEGVLYFLALLCIINQPNPPKLLLLEEPEKGIHPRRIFEVIQFILRLVEEKDVQVIMTTHSPIVVDMFKDMPESVFIFDKDEEGATHVKNLQHDVIEPETAKSKELNIEPPHYTDSLGDAWTVGFLGGVPK